MNENLLNEVESPPLNDDSGISEVVQNEKQKKAARPKRSLIKLFLLILSLLLLIAVVLAGLYVFKSGQNPFNGILKQVTFEQESPVSKLETISLSEMQRIALVKPDIPSRPPHIKNDEGETPNLLSGITLISDDLEHQVPSVEDLEEDSSLDNSLTPENNSSTLPEPSQEPRITPENLTELHDKLITEIDLKDKEILVQINALEEAIKSIEGSISGLNKKLSLYAQRTSETDNELSNIKKFVSDVNAKVKKVTYLVKKQEKKILSKKLNKLRLLNFLPLLFGMVRTLYM